MSVINSLKLNVKSQSCKFGLQQKYLYKIGVRDNPKRSFLFISTLLGKHLDVHPQIPKISGYLLANLYTKEKYGDYFCDIAALEKAIKYNDIANAVEELELKYQLPQETLFIGFAETATGLAHSVFSAFNNAYFVHTTRKDINNLSSVFDFKEEHSHAINHSCFLCEESRIKNAKEIVLIDDEITTGNTCLNLIKSLTEKYGQKKYTVLSFLNWMGAESKAKIEEYRKTQNLEIDFYAFLNGEVAQSAKPVFHNEEFVLPKLSECKLSTHSELIPQRRLYITSNGIKIAIPAYSGIFGHSSFENDMLEKEITKIGQRLRAYRCGERTLCVGSGEFIYIPSRISCYLGRNVSFKSYTRSPIYISKEIGYPINNRICFYDDNGDINYLYNVDSKRYDEVILFFDANPSNKMLNSISACLSENGIKNVKFIVI